MKALTHLISLVVFVLTSVVYSQAHAASIPWKRLVQQIDQLEPKVLPTIEGFLRMGTITNKERAGLLQLKSLYRLRNANNTEAKALFKSAVRQQCRVKLRGTMNESSRQLYWEWRAQFQVAFKCPMPWKRLATEVSRSKPTALITIRNYLKAPKLPKKDKAQLLALRALYERKKGQAEKAKASYREAIRNHCQVKLLGEMGVTLIQEFRTWGRAFRMEQRCPGYVKKPLPVPKVNKTPGRITYGVLLGLGVAGIVVGAVASGMTSGEMMRLDALSRESPGVGNTQQMRDAFSQAQTMWVTGIISYVGGGALLVAGGIVLLLTEASKAPPRSVSLSKRKEQIFGSTSSP